MEILVHGSFCYFTEEYVKFHELVRKLSMADPGALRHVGTAESIRIRILKPVHDIKKRLDVFSLRFHLS